IHNDTSLGYTARATDFSSNRLYGTNFEVRQVVLAYTDDTIWITSSKDQLENIVRLAEQFFHFNDIEINGAKSKLAVINLRIPYKDRLINFSGAKILAEHKLSNIKFLGVFLHKESEASSIKKKLKAIATVCSEIELERIHQPFLRLLKRKLEEKEVIKIANESWSSKEKVCLIALAIIIVIHRDNAEIEIEMDMDIMVKIVDKIKNSEYEKSKT
ncbi:2999_t:CDS:2, partial [Gigaspora margarita]